MTNAILTTLLFLFSLTVCSQEKIDNQLTAEHRAIKRTKISLIPPPGFIDAPNFSGFQQSESGATIMVVDVPGPYSEVSKGITKEGLLKTGVEASQIETLTLNGLPALFVTGIQSAGGNIYNKYTLVFGSAQETTIISGAVPEGLNKIGEEVKKSILTAYYEADKKVDPFESLDFSVDVSATKLKFAKAISGSLIFTADGRMPTSSNDKTTLIVGKSFSIITEQDKKLYSLNRLKQMPLQIDSIASVSEILLDDIQGYEILAKARDKKTGKPESVCQVILFSDNLYYILWGSTNDRTEKSIEDIKTAIRTFKRK